MARLFTPSESKYYLMALDAGTGSIRAVIFDLEGNQIAVGQAEWRHLAVPDVPGSMEFDLNKNWQLAKLANLKNCTTIPLKTKFIARPDKHWL